MNVKIEPSWKKALADEWDKDYFETLTRFVRGRYAERIVYPPAGRIFAAFDACPFDDVKVVILGQDPYPGAGQANGLSFSVNPEVDLPRSLRNIYTELSLTSDVSLLRRATSVSGPVRVFCCSTPPSRSMPELRLRIRITDGRLSPMRLSAALPKVVTIWCLSFGGPMHSARGSSLTVRATA